MRLQKVLSSYVHRRHCVTQCLLVWKRVYQCVSFTLVDTVLHSVACVCSWKAPKICAWGLNSFSPVTLCYVKMPLIVITGIPCSGKTTRSLELNDYFKEKLKNSGQNIEIISESDAIIQAGYDKNVYFAGKSKSEIKTFP